MPNVYALPEIVTIRLALPIPQLKGITKLAFGIGFLLSLFPGIPMLIQKEKVAVSAPIFLVAAAGTIAVVVVMSISDAINAYNKRGNN